MLRDYVYLDLEASVKDGFVWICFMRNGDIQYLVLNQQLLANIFKVSLAHVPETVANILFN